MGVFKLFSKINNLPRYTVFWGQRGNTQYEKELNESGSKGCADYFGGAWRISWWREGWHLFGGFAFGLAVKWYWIALFILITEREQERRGQKVWKSVMDLMFWAVGGVFGNVVIGLITS